MVREVKEYGFYMVLILILVLMKDNEWDYRVGDEVAPVLKLVMKFMMFICLLLADIVWFVFMCF